MTYKNNLVVAIKCQGKILREENGVVTLPFNSEYSILIKNLDSRDASIGVSIDGDDILYGKTLIVRSNSSIDLERYLDNITEGRKFKFIQKTEDIVKHLGDKVDDGIVRAEARWVKRVAEAITYKYSYGWSYNPWVYPWTPDAYWDSVTYIPGESTLIQASNTNSSISWVIPTGNQSPEIEKLSKPKDDEGITVKGSPSYQGFIPETIGELESQSTVVSIKLRGIKSNGTIITEPLTVDKKLICPTCGKKSKSNVNYCPNCGTNLK